MVIGQAGQDGLGPRAIVEMRMRVRYLYCTSYLNCTVTLYMLYTRQSGHAVVLIRSMCGEGEEHWSLYTG